MIQFPVSSRILNTTSPVYKPLQSGGIRAKLRRAVIVLEPLHQVSGGNRMHLIRHAALGVALALTATSPVLAKEKAEKTYVVNNDDVGVPVFPNDITDRPYTVVGEVKAGVRKATIFSKEASQKKIYEELWERAEKMGADAVVNAKYGDSHATVVSWGKTNATGTAVKFTAASSGIAPAPTAAASPAPSGN